MSCHASPREELQANRAVLKITMVTFNEFPDVVAGRGKKSNVPDSLLYGEKLAI